MRRQAVLVVSGVALVLMVVVAGRTGTYGGRPRQPTTVPSPVPLSAPAPCDNLPTASAVTARAPARPDPTVSSILTAANAARRRGDLRSTLALLEDAVARAPGIETHAALGALYLELGAVHRAETNLRAAAEADPSNADRWIELANALAAKPDPMAAAAALARARATEPGLQVERDPAGRLVHAPVPPTS